MDRIGWVSQINVCVSLQHGLEHKLFMVQFLQGKICMCYSFNWLLPCKPYLSPLLRTTVTDATWFEAHLVF